MRRVLFFLLFGLTWMAATSFAEGKRSFFPSEKTLLTQMAEYRLLSANENYSLDEPEAVTLEAEDKKKVSTIKAVGLSVLVPGSGHWYLGRRDRAKLFFGGEAAGWGSFAGV